MGDGVTDVLLSVQLVVEDLLTLDESLLVDVDFFVDEEELVLTMVEDDLDVAERLDVDEIVDILVDVDKGLEDDAEEEYTLDVDTLEVPYLTVDAELRVVTDVNVDEDLEDDAEEEYLIVEVPYRIVDVEIGVVTDALLLLEEVVVLAFVVDTEEDTAERVAETVERIDVETDTVDFRVVLEELVAFKLEKEHDKRA